VVTTLDMRRLVTYLRCHCPVMATLDIRSWVTYIRCHCPVIATLDIRSDQSKEKFEDTKGKQTITTSKRKRQTMVHKTLHKVPELDEERP
jgi:hypothetical protein